jgi:hypothetical protein
MLQIGIELIDEGQFIKQVNAAIRKAYKNLREFEQQTEVKTGKAVVQIGVSIQRMKDSETYFVVKTTLNVKTPSAPEKASVVVEKSGHLLCQPIGTNEEPDQQLIFDAKGRIISGGPITIDGKTGEVIDEAPPVAGTIRRAVSQ